MTYMSEYQIYIHEGNWAYLHHTERAERTRSLFGLLEPTRFGRTFEAASRRPPIMPPPKQRGYRAQFQWEDLWHAEDRDGAREYRKVVKLTHSPLASKREE